MFGLTRWSPFDEIFNFQREVDRLFERFWNDLPARTAWSSPNSFHVTSNDEGWRIDVPLPGIDPQRVTLEAVGNSLTIRAEMPANEKGGDVTKYEQSFTLPQFLDIDKVSASYRHGMLYLTIPLKDAVKPRRIEISATSEQPKQLVA
ncbi:MAG TPA: Hsp20/alpha crystallin family protein [Vicinamibacterales bacterium]|nr:Hsp20/alpha crystallin family protein [Vicinamibacterales bacterium]